MRVLRAVKDRREVLRKRRRSLLRIVMTVLSAFPRTPLLLDGETPGLCVASERLGVSRYHSMETP